tara:strand:+ start:313 stop:621 length:309 start_codon:yes stop_codon:yes gene_type:complete
MVKAILIVSMLISGGDYKQEFSSMDKCLEVRTKIIQQDNTIKAICIPKEKPSWKQQRDIKKDVVENMKINRQFCREITTLAVRLGSLMKSNKFHIPDFYGFC